MSAAQSPSDRQPRVKEERDPFVPVIGALPTTIRNLRGTPGPATIAAYVNSLLGNMKLVKELEPAISKVMSSSATVSPLMQQKKDLDQILSILRSAGVVMKRLSHIARNRRLDVLTRIAGSLERPPLQAKEPDPILHELLTSSLPEELSETSLKRSQSCLPDVTADCSPSLPPSPLRAHKRQRVSTFGAPVKLVKVEPHGQSQMTRTDAIQSLSQPDPISGSTTTSQDTMKS